MNDKREFKILTGCKTNGTTNLEFGNICQDDKCNSCYTFREEMLKYINKSFEETKNDTLFDINKYLTTNLSKEKIEEAVNEIFEWKLKG